MARYFSNFGNKLQIMLEIGKECGFTSNLDMPRSFTPCKSELRPKMANSQADCRTASLSQSRGRATISLWGREWAFSIGLLIVVGTVLEASAA